MGKIIYSVLTVISLVLITVNAIILLRATLKILKNEHEPYKINDECYKNRIIMSKPEYSTLVESYKEGYRYVVKDAYKRKLIFFEEEPIRCGAAWLHNDFAKLKYVDYWDNKGSLSKKPKYFSDLFLMVFDFIDEESDKPYLIEDLLKS